ncbi:MAG: hypothetical protein GKR90_20915 [Pseudomonadales bacterium]|nr:hypothetical protein [Pseudomonadales bacterium]
MFGFNQVHRLLVTLCTASLLLVAPSTFSHHAFSSEFDADRPFRVQGTIVRVEWINPHSWVHVDVVDDAGSVVPWMMEGGTPNALLRGGLTRTVLQVGTEVIVRGYQSKDPDCIPKCRGSGRDITFTDGRQIFMGSSGTGAPRDGADPSEGGR